MPPSSSRTSLHSFTTRPHPPLFRFLLVPMLLLLLASGSPLTLRAETDVTGIPVVEWSRLIEKTHEVESAPGTAVDHKEAPNGDIIALGYDKEPYLARFAAETGDLVWQVSPGRTNHGEAVSLVLDAQGNVFVHRKSFQPIDSKVEKYSFEDGSLQWRGQAPLLAGERSMAISRSLTVDPAGDVIALRGFMRGNQYGLQVAKYSGITGVAVWVRTHTSPAANSTHKEDVNLNIACDASGDIIAVDKVWNASHSVWDNFVMKLSGRDGLTLWTATHHDPAHRTTEPSAIAVDASGNVWVLNVTNSPSGSWINKFAHTSGMLLWSRPYNDKYARLQLDADGEGYVTGANSAGQARCARIDSASGFASWQASYGGVLALTDSAPRRVLLGSGETATALNADSGQWLWSERFESPPGYPSTIESLQAAADGTASLFGRTPSPAQAYAVKKVSPSGSLLWAARNVPPVRTDHLSLGFAKHAPSAGFVMATHIPDEERITLARRSREGDVVWESDLAGITATRTPMAAFDAEGNAFVCASMRQAEEGEDQLFLAKHAVEDGSKLWEIEPPAPGGQIIVTAQGDVCFVQGPTQGPDLTVRKHSGATGALLWETVYHLSGTYPSDPGISAVATTDPSGHLVAGLNARDEGSGHEFFVLISLDATTGGQRWERRFPPRSSVTHLATNSAGDVFFFSPYPSSGVTKLSGLDGSTIWLRQSVGSYPDLVFGPDGHLVVVSPAYAYDLIQVFKLNTATGQTLWTKHVSLNPFAQRAICFDDRSNVVVATSTRRLSDIFMAALKASDGGMLWEAAAPGGGLASFLSKDVFLYDDQSMFVGGMSGSNPGIRLTRMRIAQTVPDISVRLPGSATELDGQTSTVHWGEIEIPDSVTKTLVVSNQGNEPLQVSGMELNGPDAALFRIEGSQAFFLAPGAAREVTVRIQSGVLGPSQALLVMRSSDPDEAEFRIPMVFHNVTPEVEVFRGTTMLSNGSGVIELGTLPVGQAHAVPIKIRNVGSGALTLSYQFTGRGAPFCRITNAVSSLAPLQSGTIYVVCEPTIAAAGDAGFVLRIGSNDRDENPFEVVFSARVEGTNLAVAAGDGTSLPHGAVLDFGVVPPGGSASRVIRLRNEGTQPLRPFSVEFSDPAFSLTEGATLPAELLPGEAHEMVVTFSPAAASPVPWSQVLTIHSNDPDEGTRTVLLEANRLLPSVQAFVDGSEIISGHALDFGTVVGAARATSSLTIRNLGPAPLEGVILKVNGDPHGVFALGSEVSGVTLLPGEEMDIELAFTPRQARGYASHLEITSLATPLPTSGRIALFGRGDAWTLKNIAQPATQPGSQAVMGSHWNPDVIGKSYHGIMRDAITSRIVGPVQMTVFPDRDQPHEPALVSVRLTWEGKSASLIGGFDRWGFLQFSRRLPDGGLLQGFLRLHSHQGGALHSIRGTLTHAGREANVDLYEAYFSKTRLAPETVVGAYTFLLPGMEGRGLAEPGGDGWATGKVSTTGIVTLSGMLGDGTKVTQSGSLSYFHDIQLFAPLYRTRPQPGHLAGRLVFREVAGTSDCDGVMEWLKLPNAREPRYAAGFALDLPIIGSRYAAPAKGQRVLSQLGNDAPNASLSLLSPRLPADAVGGEIERAVGWLPTHAIQHYGPDALSAKVNLATGSFSGGYTSAATREKVAFSGVAFQKQGLAAGSFVFGGVSGTVRIMPMTDVPHPGSESAGAWKDIRLPSAPAAPPSTTDIYPEPAAAGLYAGSSVSTGQVTGGLEAVRLTAGGTLSGTVWVGNLRYSFRGMLEQPISIRRPGQTDLTLQLSLTRMNGEIGGFGLRGTLQEDALAHQLTARRQPSFTRALPSPHARLYTLAMVAPEESDPALTPAGNGSGNLSVSYLGTCTGALILPDGTATTFSGHLGHSFSDAGVSTAEWFLHRALYGKTPRGFLSGKVAFRSVPGVSDLDGSWRWVKQPNTAPLAVYPGGIDTTRLVVGGAYTPPAKGRRAFPGLESAPTHHHLWLRLAGPDLSPLPLVTVEEIDRALTWTTANKVIHYGPQKVGIGFNVKTGLLSGSYVDAANGVNVKFSGALLQGQGLVTGSYLSQGRSGALLIEPRRSAE